MEIKTEYEKACQKVWELRAIFYRQYGFKPNSVNIGHDEFYTLKNGNNHLIGNMDNKGNVEHTIFGMKVNRVVDDKHLSVGFYIE